MQAMSLINIGEACAEEALCEALRLCSLASKDSLKCCGLLTSDGVLGLVKNRRMLAASGISVAHLFGVPNPMTAEGLLAICLLAPLWASPVEAVIDTIVDVPVEVLRALHAIRLEDDATLEERAWVWRVLAACELHPETVEWRRNDDGTWNVLRPLFFVDVEHDVFTEEQATCYRAFAESMVEVQAYFRMSPEVHPVLAGGFVERVCMHVLGKRYMHDGAIATSDVDIFAERLGVEEFHALRFGVAAIQRSCSVLTVLLHCDAIKHHGMRAGTLYGLVKFVLTSLAKRPEDVIASFDMTHCRAYIKHRGGPMAAASTVCAWLDGKSRFLPGRPVSEQRVAKGLIRGYEVFDASGASEGMITKLRGAVAATVMPTESMEPCWTVESVLRHAARDGDRVFSSVKEVHTHLKIGMRASKDKGLQVYWNTGDCGNGCWGDTFCGIYPRYPRIVGRGVDVRMKRMHLEETHIPHVTMCDLVCRLLNTPLRAPCALTESATFPHWSEDPHMVSVWLGRKISEEQDRALDSNARALFSGPVSPLLGDNSIPFVRTAISRLVRFQIPQALQPRWKRALEAIGALQENTKPALRVTWRGYMRMSASRFVDGIMVDFVLLAA